MSRAYRDGVHEGIDLPSKIGTPVYAVKRGVVRSVNPSDSGNAGKSVTILHPDNWLTVYYHLDQPLVQKGETVSGGQTIGRSGETGAARGSPHLHFATFLPKGETWRYAETFGVPTTNFGPDGEKISGFLAVPSEPLVPVAYKPSVIENARAKNVPLYQAGSILPVILAVGAGYVVWRAIG